MSKLKDKMYNYFVRKNGRIWYEYERYVREHMEEHRLHRFNHIRLLIKLNWFYRVKKGNTPYIYWDVPIKPQEISKQKNNHLESKLDGNVFNGVESESINLPDAYHFAKQLMGYDVISFDIFDTLIFRKVAKPTDVFLFVQMENQVYRFCEERINAEIETRNRKELLVGNREISIFDIYNYLEKKIGINAKEGVELEFLTECDMCEQNPYMVEVFELLKSQEKQIILVSDMYYPSEFLDDLLQKKGIVGYSKIYVSCEYECNKSGGYLFDAVLKDNKDKKIIHIGDNLKSDVEVPRSLQIMSKYYPNVNQMGEKYRIVTRAMSDFIGSAYAGLINKYIRNGSKKYGIKYEYGFIYGGLYVLGYVCWIHEFAIKNKIDKIMFLSRDGYIYSKVFNLLFDDVKNEYVYWSRTVTARVAVKNNRRPLINYILLAKKDEKGWLKSTLDNLYISGILQGISAGKLFEIENNNDSLIDFLNMNWNIITESVASSILATKEILKRTVSNCESVAVVDVGWNGSSGDQIQRLLGESCIVYSLVVGSLCKNGEFERIQSNRQYAYAFSEDKNRSLYDLFQKDSNRVASIFELFTQAHSPMFRGYVLKEDGVEYDFFDTNVDMYDEIDSIHKGIIEFCKEWKKSFMNYQFMFNISGWDALNPFRVMVSDKYYVKNQLIEAEVIKINN
ncbi:MAG: hypothetical protein K2J95_05330 [Lachnospiraceae bacterium]|nr:hypothetical protein [Lachnospiraceae bacterium]